MHVGIYYVYTPNTFQNNRNSHNITFLACNMQSVIQSRLQEKLKMCFRIIFVFAQKLQRLDTVCETHPCTNYMNKLPTFV